ncbi:Hypothetical_protein [Hexamita inflata]|uniref:Hypothetical_protein n=1 Tax=Hexamita inflata TaxID=28002 RepID=A0AA86UY54_9EUKA|nr:Hypothetical protein HINF_LOCUS56866 [Hexamita inflata]
MECFSKYSDCIDVRTGNQECKYYEDLYMYCYFSVKNVAWCVWLILAVIIIMFISFITCCVCCCCQKKRAQYQRIVEVKCLSEEQEHLLPVQNAQACKQYQQVQNFQQLIPPMFVPQPVYQQMPTGIPNYNYQYGVQQQSVPHHTVPMLHIMK